MQAHAVLRRPSHLNKLGWAFIHTFRGRLSCIKHVIHVAAGHLDLGQGTAFAAEGLNRERYAIEARGIHALGHSKNP